VLKVFVPYIVVAEPAAQLIPIKCMSIVDVNKAFFIEDSSIRFEDLSAWDVI
jgi:hypothetical protein